MELKIMRAMATHDPEALTRALVSFFQRRVLQSPADDTLKYSVANASSFRLVIAEFFIDHIL
jgi:hypothetical protein